jgi:hypothetical protein
MATEASYEAPTTPGAPTNPANRGPALTPEEVAEFIDSLKEDEAPAHATECNDYDPEYND